jgi:anti-sigma factor RsiW
MAESADAVRGCRAPDPRLAALLDGELAAAEQRQLDEHLRVCRCCADDLAQQRLARAALRRTAEVLLPSSSLEARVLRGLAESGAPRSIRRRALLFGGVAAVIAVGLGGGVIIRGREAVTAAVLRRAVGAHQAVTLGASSVSLGSSDPAAVSAWARQQTGRSVDVPGLEGAGYSLRGARLDSSVASKAVALVYESAEIRMTCTVMPPASLPGASDEIRVTAIGDVHVATWADADSAYIMVAQLSPADLLQLARQVQRTAF